MIVWTCLDPAFPFFLCQSSCATLCAHIHHKKTCVSALKNITCPSQIPVVGDVTIHFGSRSWPHHHCCQKDPWQPGNLVDAKILFHSWKCKMAPVRICQSLIHQPFSCSPSYKLYTQSLPKSIYVRIKGLVTITSTGGAFAAAAVPLRPRRQPAVPPSPWAPAARARQPGKPMGKREKPRKIRTLVLNCPR